MNLEQFLTKKYLDKGQYSKCYVLQDGNVFKQFNKPRNIVDINKFKYFLEYNNENFLFPFEFIHDNKKFYGYITKRATGQTFENAFLNCDLEILSKNSINLEKNINYVSKGKIVMYDFHSENMMYDENLLQVIDADEYCIRDNWDIEYIKYTNFKYYRTLITNCFITNIKRDKYTQYILDKINKYKYSDGKVSDIILHIKDDMEKYYREDINTIDELKKIIRR